MIFRVSAGSYKESLNYKSCAISKKGIYLQWTVALREVNRTFWYSLNRLVPPAEDILRVKRDLDIEGGKIERLL